MYLEDIIAGIDIEGNKIECKAILNRSDVVVWLKTVAESAVKPVILEYKLQKTCAG